MATTSEIEKIRRKLKRDQERADKRAQEEKAFTGWIKKKKTKYWVNPAKLQAHI
jgi:hypothetical protein